MSNISQGLPRAACETGAVFRNYPTILHTFLQMNDHSATKKAPECCFSISYILLPVLVDVSVTLSVSSHQLFQYTGPATKTYTVITKCLLLLNNQHLLRLRLRVCAN